MIRNVLSTWGVKLMLTTSFVVLSNILNAQIKDSVIFTPLINFHGGFHLPGGDLINRFGLNGAAGGGFQIKTKKNLYLGVSSTFIFGGAVKERNMLDGIKTNDGQVLNFGGFNSDVNYFERGFTLFLETGLTVYKLGPNPNCGFVLFVSPGYVQHKIRIQDNDEQAVHIRNDYAKGYDRLTNGFAVKEFVGYRFFSNSKTVNFYAGFELIQGFTQNRRDFNFDLRKKDTTQRLDLLNGFIIGWSFPLYKRTTNEFYYN